MFVGCGCGCGCVWLGEDPYAALAGCGAAWRGGVGDVILSGSNWRGEGSRDNCVCISLTLSFVKSLSKNSRWSLELLAATPFAWLTGGWLSVDCWLSVDVWLVGAFAEVDILQLAADPSRLNMTGEGYC